MDLKRTGRLPNIEMVGIDTFDALLDLWKRDVCKTHKLENVNDYRGGYGKGYEYDHDRPGHFSGQECLPEELRGAKLYEPSGQGLELEIAKRMEAWAVRRSEIQAERGTNAKKRRS